MKIWIINHYAEVPPKGNYLRHFRFSKELQKMGHEVEIFAASTVHNSTYNHSKDSRPFKKVLVEGVPVTFIKCRNYKGNGKDRVLNILDYFFGVMKVTKKLTPPDIVYSSSPHPLNWLAGEKIAKRGGARHIAETRDLWPETFVSMNRVSRNHPLSLLLYQLEKRIYSQADALIFTFPGGELYLKENAIRSQRVENINNGVDLRQFDDQVQSHFSSKISERTDVFKVVYTGALNDFNSIDLLIDAAKMMKNQTDIHIYVYGDGYHREALIEKSKDLPISFMGRVEKKLIPGILSRSDLNVMIGQDLSILKYGLSLNKMFEYMASEKPILSNLNTLFDVIQENGAGITVPGNDPVALADGIKYFKNLSESDYQNYARNSRKLAEKYDFIVLSRKLENLFQEVLNEQYKSN
jgi:glycosyltransferase involved in cell wall biosynthesis